MYVSIGIHRDPKPEMKHLLIASMKRFEAAMREHKGCRDVYQLEDENTGALVGLAIWDSKEDFAAARPHFFKAIENDPFDEWEDSEPEGFRLIRVLGKSVMSDATIPARRFIYELVNLRLYKIAPEIIAEDCTYVSPANTYHGIDDCMNYMQKLFEAWNDFQISVLDISEDSGHVLAQITVEAMPVREILGIPPSFKRISLPATAHFQVRGGKIKMLKIDYEFARLLIRD